MSAAVGVDIGGSGIRAAIVGAEGELSQVQKVPLSHRSIDEVLDVVADLVQDDLPVGVGMPGFVQDGVVRASPNFPAWVDVPLESLLRQRLSRSVRVDNDANLAALGAWMDGRQDLVLLTLGTGVGGGVVTGGRVLRGQRGSAAELGHLYVGGDLRCGCGARGCLETWCSITGLRARAERDGHTFADGRALFEAVDSGEAWARDLINVAAEKLGFAMASYANVFGPDEIVVAGGLSEALGWRDRSTAAFEQQVIGANHCPIRWVGSATRLAIRGAAALVADEVCASPRR